jgi:hypothetical protein
MGSNYKVLIADQLHPVIGFQERLSEGGRVGVINFEDPDFNYWYKRNLLFVADFYLAPCTGNDLQNGGKSSAVRESQMVCSQRLAGKCPEVDPAASPSLFKAGR